MKKGTYIDIDGGNLDVCNKCVQPSSLEKTKRTENEGFT